MSVRVHVCVHVHLELVKMGGHEFCHRKAFELNLN